MLTEARCLPRRPGALHLERLGGELELGSFPPFLQKQVTVPPPTPGWAQPPELPARGQGLLHRPPRAPGAQPPVPSLQGQGRLRARASDVCKVGKGSKT